MTTQTPMTVEAVFEGYDSRTNEGREGDRHFFSGHLDFEQISALYFSVYPEHRAQFPYVVGAGGIEHAWHVFTLHEDDCYLIAGADLDDPFDSDELLSASLCSCAAQQGFEDHPSYYHRHPHPATAATPGAIPVTWVTIRRSWADVKETAV